jgi:diguanylate cyclase (GGDEF)-like protein
MDPLVRATLAVQRGLARVSGVFVSLAFAAYFVAWAAERKVTTASLAALGLLVVVTAYPLVRRLAASPGQPQPEQDFALWSRIILLTEVWAFASTPNLDGPLHALVYVVVMLAAGFTTPLVMGGVVVYTIGLEVALALYALRTGLGPRVVTHAALVPAFAFLNLLLFRAEIARVRRLSKSRVESELKRLKEAARSYRLLGAPATAAEPRGLRPAEADEERLLHSGVDEIQTALRFALDLLRQSLGLKSAALLWLNASGKELHIQEISSGEQTLLPGPFGARDGLSGAALARNTTVSLVGPKAAKHVPYYGAPTRVGAVCAVPVVEHGHTRGLLVVDREQREPFTSREEELLAAASRFMVRAVENERVFVQLERAKSEQGKLYRAAGALSAATTEAQVIEAGVNSAREFAAFDFAVVTLFDRDLGEHEICAVSGEGAEHLVGARFRHNSGLVSMVVANRHALPYRGDYDPARQIVFTRRLLPPPMASLLVLPLSVHERALGTLVLGSHRKNAFSDAVKPTLEVLASHVAVSLANARMLKRLEELATTDGLTGVYNKRALTEQAARKLKSAARYKKPLAVLVADIDFFKRVNDTYGHDVGDLVIKGMADVLMRVKRDTDVVGRFGGEEFVVVCEETDAAGAQLLAERIRSELAATTFHTELGPLSVTCSVGVAPFPSAGDTWDALFKATDEALYASKRGGRNRVTVWTPKLQGCAA